MMPSHTATTSNTSPTRLSRCQTVASRRARKSPGSTSAHFTAVNRFVTKFLSDPQQLVILGHAIRPAKGTGLDLARIRRHRDVCNGRILRFAGAMADDRGVIVFHGQ